MRYLPLLIFIIACGNKKAAQTAAAQAQQEYSCQFVNTSQGHSCIFGGNSCFAFTYNNFNCQNNNDGTVCTASISDDKSLKKTTCDVDKVWNYINLGE